MGNLLRGNNRTEDSLPDARLCGYSLLRLISGVAASVAGDSQGFRPVDRISTPQAAKRGGTPTVRKLLELVRFSHTLFALPFALLAAALAWADEPFRWQDLLGILLCMVFARSAAMAFNRLADRHIDAKNPRTAIRHLPAGTLSVAAVWLFTVVCCVGFVASTLLF